METLSPGTSAMPPVMDGNGDAHAPVLASETSVPSSDRGDEATCGKIDDSDQTGRPSLSHVARVNRFRISATYLLFVLENLIRMSEPFFLGLAVDGLIRGEWNGLLAFIGQYAGRILIGAFRHTYDTRTFAGIYAGLGASLVRQQRTAGVPVTCIAARTALSREITDFFERDIPILVYGLFNVIGSIVMIGWCDRTSMLLCLGLCVPVALTSRAHAGHTAGLNRQLNDEYERQVETITQGVPIDIDRHFEAQRVLQIRISDREAISFTWNHALLLIVTALCLISACRTTSDPGRLLALFQYLTLLAASLTQLPLLIQQLTRLHDILNRLGTRSGE